jgi:S1-C subfamily serine protease
MKSFLLMIGGFILVVGASIPAAAQQTASVPVDTQMTLDAAPTVQKTLVPEVRYLKCPKTSMKGTGFLLSTGVVITAAHVVCGCEAADVVGTIPTTDREESFSSIVRDNDLDIAALIPKEPEHGGLELAGKENVALGQQVNTWGYPLIYNGPAPILSVGYASGYHEVPEMNVCDSSENSAQLKIKHIIVNAAFNPGNSGGPLFVYGQNKVVGVVVWKSIAFSTDVQAAINGFHHPRASMGGTFTERQPDGTYKGITDEEVIARVLEEFYNKVQVNIGEAVSVSELREFLKDHSNQLPAAH